MNGKSDEEARAEARFNELFAPHDPGTSFRVYPVSSPAAKGTMAVRFEGFHRENPHIYQAIVRIALDLKDRGFPKCGMKMIFERLRWLYAIQTRGEDFKLNNNYTAYYARVVMAAEPRLQGFFETRVREGDIPYVPDLEALGLR